jgi:hypothetical protein
MKKPKTINKHKGIHTCDGSCISIFKEEDLIAVAKAANKDQRDLVKAWEEKRKIEFEEILIDWEFACGELSSAFLDELYENETMPEVYWIADEVGGVLHFNDYFVSTNIMADYFKYGYTPDQFFDWYDKCYLDEGCKINMKNFIKLEKPPENTMPF